MIQERKELIQGEAGVGLWGLMLRVQLGNAKYEKE